MSSPICGLSAKVQRVSIHEANAETAAEQQLVVFYRPQEDVVSQPAMHMSLTDRLPNEILAMIFARLPKTSMKTVRLVCKLFAQLAEPYLFDVAVISPNTENLDVFKALGHSLFSKHVKEIVFDTTMFRKEYDLVNYTSKVQAQWKQSPNGADLLSAADVLEGFEAYRAHAEEQQILLESGEFLATLCLGFAKFAQLKSIRLNGIWTKPGKASQLDLCGALRRNWNSRYLRACGCPCPKHDASGHLNARAFADILRGLSMFGCKLDHFYGKPSLLVPAHLFGNMSASTLSHGMGAFRHLRFLSFGFTPNTTPAATTALFTLIQSARHLRELILLFHPGMTTCINDLIRTHTWPQLQKVRFHGIKVNAGNLLAMMHRHVRSLQCLWLTNAQMTDGMGVQVVKKIRDDTALKDFTLGKLVHGTKGYRFIRTSRKDGRLYLRRPGDDPSGLLVPFEHYFEPFTS